MTRWIIALLVALLPLQKAFAMGKAPSEHFTLAPSNYEWTYQEKLLVKNSYDSDGITISGNIFVPKPSFEGETFPTLILPNSWLMEEHEYWVQGRKFCEKGYIVLSYSARGWGCSEGQVNVGGPEDIQDIRAIIDWVIANKPVKGVVRNEDGTVADDSGALIGMCGISLGGGLALIGAAADKRIKAVMAMVPWGDLTDALYLNQSTKPVWHKGVLVGLGDVMSNLNPHLARVTDWLFNHEHEEHFDDILPWAMERSPIKHLASYNDPDRDLAICISTNVQDFLFTPNQTLRFFYGLNILHKRIDFNRGVHTSAELPGLAGIPTAVWNRAYAWFDQHLKGVETGILDNPEISIENKSDNTKRYYVDHLYIKDINTKHLEGIERSPIDNANAETTLEKRYLGPRPWYRYRGGLGTHKGYSGSNTIRSGLASGMTLGVPILTPILEAHTKLLHLMTSLPLTSRKKAIVYASERFSEKRTILGTPSMTLTLTPNNDRVQLIAHLYSVDWIGMGTLIGQAPLTLLESDRLLPSAEPGVKKTYEFNFITLAADVPKGHRLAIGIDTFDPSYGKASDEDFEVTIHYGDNTFVEIPYQ